MKPIEKALDVLWAKAVKVKSGGRCELCFSSKATESHHVISRRHKAVRWDVSNGVALCFECHREVHDGHIHLIPSEEVTEKAREAARFSTEDYEAIKSELKSYTKREVVCT